MENYCAFSKNHKCLNWTDYELTRYELEEAGSLCQAKKMSVTPKSNEMVSKWCKIKKIECESK